MKRLAVVTALSLAIGLTSAYAQQRPVVNINTATEKELAYLPGIGPKLAEAIYIYAEGAYALDNSCDHRCHFRTVDDLLKVGGIGPKKLARIRPYVVVSGPTTARAKIRDKKE